MDLFVGGSLDRVVAVAHPLAVDAAECLDLVEILIGWRRLFPWEISWQSLFVTQGGDGVDEVIEPAVEKSKSQEATRRQF